MPTLPIRDQSIEFLVKASSSNDAKALTSKLVSHSASVTIIEHSPGYFLIADSFDGALLDTSFYAAVWSSAELAILSDSSQKARRDRILDEVEKAESCLRGLLLRANGFIEDYYNLFVGPYTAKHAKKETVIKERGIDPITSLLTFEGMVAILGTDVSWSTREIVSVHDMIDILDDVEDIKSLRQKLKDKVKQRLVWDAISDGALIKAYDWHKVAGEINAIKDLRNDAAHFHILTETDVKNAQKRVKTLLKKIGPSNQKPQKEVNFIELSDVFSQIREQFTTQNLEIIKALQPSRVMFETMAAQTQTLSAQLTRALLPPEGLLEDIKRLSVSFPRIDTETPEDKNQ
jgi:hypothetical protein